MLGRFICPAARLGELHAFGSLFQDRPLRLCVLPSPSSALKESIRSAVSSSDAFRGKFAGRVSVDVFEARAPRPNTPPPTPDELRELSAETGGRWLYLEWPVADAGLTQRLADLGTARRAGANMLAAKIRCGGVEPAAYPSVEKLSSFLHHCVQQGVPFKATAGLHHPVRHVSGDVTMHGFLNVFGAAILAKVHDLDASAIQLIVGEMRPESFVLDGGGLIWRHLTANAEQVRAVRTDLAHSYGSCSFDDPTNDLKARDWFRSTTPAQ